MNKTLDCNQLSLLERKKLLKGISKTAKEYKTREKTITDLRKGFTVIDELKEVFEDAFSNHEAIKSDSKIILDNIKIVRRHLDIIEGIENIDNQRKLLDSMSSINEYFLLFILIESSYNSNFSDEAYAYNKDNKIISLMVDRYGVKPNESGLVMPDAINASINDKHNELLKLTDEIHMIK